MNILKSTFYCFIFSLLLTSSKAQSGQTHWLSGTIKDSKGNAVSLVNLYDRDNKCIAISNMEGRFKLIKERITGNYITFYHINYKPFSIKLDSIKEDTIIVKLEGNNILLKEITISAFSAEQIVQKVIDNIYKNYPQELTKVNADYKCVSLSNGKNNTFFDGNIDLWLKSYSKKNKKIFTRLKSYNLYKAKGEKLFFRHTESAIEDAFVVNNHPFVKDFFDYSFIYQGSTNYKGSSLYVISYKPKLIDEHSVQYEGKIYIDETTWAVVYSEYSLLKNSIVTKIPILNISGYYLHYSNKTMYSKINNTYQLSYCILKDESNISIKDRLYHLEGLDNLIVVEYFNDPGEIDKSNQLKNINVKEEIGMPFKPDEQPSQKFMLNTQWENELMMDSNKNR